MTEGDPHPRMTNMVSYSGLDGTLHLTEAGVTFERSKSRALGRGVPAVHQVPWTAVAGAHVDKASLRIDVAGFESPRMNTADPHAVAFLRGQREAAVAFADLVKQQAAGVEARPTFSDLPSPQAPRASAPPSPLPHAATVRVGSSTARVFRLAEIALWLQLVLLLIPLILVVTLVVLIVF